MKKSNIVYSINPIPAEDFMKLITEGLDNNPKAILYNLLVKDNNGELCEKCHKRLMKLLKKFPGILTEEGIKMIQPDVEKIQKCPNNIAKCFQHQEFRNFGQFAAAKQTPVNMNNPRFAGCQESTQGQAKSIGNTIGSHHD